MVVDPLRRVRICRALEPDIAVKMVATPTLDPEVPPVVVVVVENTLADTTVALAVVQDSPLVPQVAPRYLAKEI